MIAALAGACLLAQAGPLFAGAPSVSADGSIPPQPYNYLQPPPALRAGNNPPAPGARTFPAATLRSSRWLLFTGDGQAGIYAPNGAFALAPATSAVQVTIRAVIPPPGLPAGLAVDGNAYRITAAQRPGNAPARLIRPATLTLLWPHLPRAIYTYRGTAWRRLCSFDQMTRTPSTVSCPIHALGLFAAVHAAPPAPRRPPPRRPIPRGNGPSAAIIAPAIVVALLLIALAALLLRRRTVNRHHP